MRWTVLALVLAINVASTANAQSCAQTDSACKYHQGANEIGGIFKSAPVPIEPRPATQAPPPYTYTPPPTPPPTPPTQEELDERKRHEREAEERTQAARQATSDAERAKLQAEKEVRFERVRAESTPFLFKKRFDEIAGLRESNVIDVIYTGEDAMERRVTDAEIALGYAMQLGDPELISKAEQWVFEDRGTGLQDGDARKHFPTRNTNTFMADFLYWRSDWREFEYQVFHDVSGEYDSWKLKWPPPQPKSKRSKRR